MADLVIVLRRICSDRNRGSANRLTGDNTSSADRCDLRIAGAVAHIGLGAGFNCYILPHFYLIGTIVDGKDLICLPDFKLLDCGTNVITLTSNNYFSRTNIGVIRIGNFVVPATGQSNSTILYRDSRLFRCAVISVGSDVQKDIIIRDILFCGTRSIVVNGHVFQIIRTIEVNLFPLFLTSRIIHIRQSFARRKCIISNVFYTCWDCHPNQVRTTVECIFTNIRHSIRNNDSL